jgi:GNAT superfamily N-acetyltransferase
MPNVDVSVLNLHYAAELVIRIFLAEIDGGVVGFVHYELGPDKLSGKLGLNAVHPKWQRRGIAAKLYARFFDILRAEGMKFGQVGTGGDEAHIPARCAYEKVRIHTDSGCALFQEALRLDEP